MSGLSFTIAGRDEPAALQVRQLDLTRAEAKETALAGRADVAAESAVCRVAEDVDAARATIRLTNITHHRSRRLGLDAESPTALPAGAYLATEPTVSGIRLQVNTEAEAIDQTLIGAG